MLKVEGLNQSYGQSHTLWDVNLEVGDGACVSLIGRNGKKNDTCHVRLQRRAKDVFEIG